MDSMTYQLRSEITYTNFLGQDVTVLVIAVTDFDGKPGFLGVPKGGSEGEVVWGYADQVTSVVRF